MQIGSRMKALRKQKRLTLVQISERTGLSVSYLSNIEHDRTSPTLNNVESITQAMDLPMSSLLQEIPTDIVVKKDHRMIIYDIPNKIRWEYIIKPGSSLCGICTVFAPHSVPVSGWGHDFEEACVVIEGKLLVTIGQKEHRLEEGDSIIVPKNTGHVAENKSDAPCTCYWFSTGERK